MPKSSNAFVVTVTGPDRPGITAALVRVFADHNTIIRDIEQITNAGNLNLSFHVVIAEGKHDAPFFKDLLFSAWELGVRVDFRPFTPPQKMEESRAHYALTLLGTPVGSKAIAEVTQVLASKNINIDRISRLSGDDQLDCLEMSLSAHGSVAVGDVKKLLLPVAQNTGVDLALQREGLVRRVKRLVVFDMDSTLIQGEIIDELAKSKGVEKEVSAITQRAMRGEIDFSMSLRERVGLLAGTPVQVLDDIYQSIRFSPGARDLVRVLKRLGYRLAVISGGFTYFTDKVRHDLGFDFAYSNQLEVRDGKLTGALVGSIVDGQRKADLLIAIAQSEGISLDQVIAIGDGANDIAMLELAGLGIAFNAKAKVQKRADHAINRPRLDSILFLLGISQRDQEVLLKAQ